MSTSSHIIVEDKNGKFHCRFHHYDGYVAGGLGSALLDNFPSEADAKFLISINKDFLSITNGVKEVNAKKDRYVDYCLIEYGNNMVITSDSALFSFCNLEDALMSCQESFIYLFSQNDKKWYLRWRDNLCIDLEVIHGIDSVFKDISEGVEVKFYDGVRHVDKMKSLFHGGKNSANLCSIVKKILDMDNAEYIINYLSDYYGHFMDVDNIVNEVKILNVHDGLNKEISISHKKTSSKKRTKI